MIEEWRSKIEERIHWASEKVNSFTLRERILLLITALVAIYMIWNTLIFGVFFPTEEEIKRSTQAMRDKIVQLQEQISGVSKALSGERELMNRINQLKAENENLKKEITEQTKKMVLPKDMLAIVKSLINESKGLTVISLKNAEPKELFPELTQTKVANIYVHEIHLEVAGTYFDLLNFLKALEAKNMKMIWSELNYEVKKYPYAQIKIVLQTLSTEAGWIGV